MRATSLLVSTLICISGCTTSTTRPSYSDPRAESTLILCRRLANSADQQYRNQIAQVLVRRGATVEKCLRLINSDNSIAAGIAVAGVAVAAGAAASNSGGGYYSGTGSYGVAWDQFYNEYYQLIWRCRDRATGQFVYDYNCSGKSMVDTTWPGWSA
jgi:hypothetical protein